MKTDGPPSPGSFSDLVDLDWEAIAADVERKLKTRFPKSITASVRGAVHIAYAVVKGMVLAGEQVNNPAGLMWTIASRDLAKEYKRFHNPRETLEEPGIIEEGFPSEESLFSQTSCDPARVLMAREFCETLYSLIEELPDRLHLPLVLHWVDGLSNAKIAERLDIAEGTAANNLSAARKTLAAKMARRGFPIRK